MKKLFIVILALSLLTGCRKVTRQLDEEKYNAYLMYYQSIIEAENKIAASSNFDTEVVVNKLSDGNYRYDVIIDNPRVAMLSIKALAIPDGIQLEVDKENMMPSVGILDDLSENMIPGQVDLDKNYVEGIILSLISDQPSLKISVMVDFNDLSGFKSHRDYVSIFAEYVEPETENKQ